MFADTEAFFTLLAFSVAVGASLGFFYDSLMLAVDTVLPEKKKREGRVVLPHNARLAQRALFPIERRVSARDITLIFTDIFFFITSAFAVIILLYHLNYGEVRAFSLVSALVGFVVFRKTLGRPLIFLMKRVIMLLKLVLKKTTWVIRRILIVLLKPFRAIIKRTLSPLIYRLRVRQTKKKARKYLELMQENEDRRTEKRKNKNERDKSIRAER